MNFYILSDVDYKPIDGTASFKSFLGAVSHALELLSELKLDEQLHIVGMNSEAFDSTIPCHWLLVMRPGHELRYLQSN